MSLFRRRDILETGLAAALIGAGFPGRRASAAARLTEIPLFDARDGGPVQHAAARVEAMRKLLQSCLASLPATTRWSVAAIDAAARSWLRASSSPYVDELDAIAARLKDSGVYMLNTSFEWGCTTLAAPSPDSRGARLLRTLDWNLDGLGRHVEVVRQRGSAGEFLNVTWPGAVGVLTAMAPGRFAASINKGPSTDGWGGVGLPNLGALGGGLAPSMHVLRQVFETSMDFDAARRRLEETPIAAETIFTLVGTTAEQTCVIERKPRDFATHLGPSTAANTWNYGVEARSWNVSTDEAVRQDSAERRSSIASFARQDIRPFAWVKPPLRNDITRLAVEANPATGLLRVRGYEASKDREDAVPVTEDFEWHG